MNLATFAETNIHHDDDAGRVMRVASSPPNKYFVRFLFSPNSRIMLHQPSGGAQGMASDIEIQAKEILRTRANLNKLYVHHTSQKLEDVEGVMDRDTFFDPQQALDFGVIDEILEKRPHEDAEEADNEKSKD